MMGWRYIWAQLRALLGGVGERPPPWDKPHSFDPDALDSRYDVCRHCGCSRTAADLGLACWGPGG